MFLMHDNGFPSKDKWLRDVEEIMTLSACEPVPTRHFRKTPVADFSEAGHIPRVPGLAKVEIAFQGRKDQSADVLRSNQQ